MNGKYRRFQLIVAAALALGSISTTARATTMFGSLSNFDAINDTGQITRGFEIELEGIHPADISFTFGNPYIRYGDPVKIDTGTGTIVRYASGFDGSAWAVGTPAQDPLNPIMTGGHQLFFQGDPNYINEPGDHFGVALNANPTNTTYRWMLGDAAGNLTPAGTNVKIPAPVWNVQPPANAAAPAAVQAIVPALPIVNPGDVFGEAVWAKVFVTESSSPAELEHLLVGDPAMPGETEVEIEWQLLQAGKGNGMDQLDSGLHDLAVGGESITRRYEFYKYIGPLDPENGEALVEDALLHPEAVGEFLGGQNAAINLLVPEPGTITMLGMGLAGIVAHRWRRRKGIAA
jgi:hypothetical protein